MMKTFRKLFLIEFKLSIRDMNMAIFAIAMPLIMLIVLGMIYGNEPAFQGAGYTFIEQSFGPLTTIGVYAGGLMGLPLVISEYRERKILKRYQVTPISPLMILFVQLMIYTVYALSSLVTLWLLAKIFYGFRMHGSLLLFMVGWLLVLISILSVGMLVGGIAKDNKQASIIASVLYFPMLIFSGATLPYEVMPIMMQKIVDIFPLTQGIKLLKETVINGNVNNIFFSGIIIILVSIICAVLAQKWFKWE